MYAKTIKYTDYNDVAREETFYFNLNRAELLKMMVTDSDATLDQVFEYFQQTRNGAKLLAMIEDLIKASFGIKSPDGKAFIKKQEYLDMFVQSEAYSELLTELLNDADKAADFFVKILPKNLQEDVDKFYREHPNITPSEARKLAAESSVEANVTPIASA